MNGPGDYPVNAYLKASHRGLWGATKQRAVKALDAERIETINEQIARCPRFRMPYNMNQLIKGEKPYAGVRMPYGDMVLEFQHDDAERPHNQPGQVVGTVEFVHLQEMYQTGPADQVETVYLDGDPRGDPVGFMMVVPVWFEDERTWGVFPWAAFVLYPDQTVYSLEEESAGDTWLEEVADKDRVLAIMAEKLLPETAALFEDRWDKEGQSQADKRDLLIAQLRDVTYEVMAFLSLMTCRNVKRIEVAPSASARKKAAKAGKIPPYTYHTLDIFLDDVQRHAAPQGGKHEPPRLHRVRGHFKNRSTGRFWWRPFARGNRGRGQVDKTYQLKQKRQENDHDPEQP